MRLEVLQALRAIAAAFVVLLHAFYTYSDKIAVIDPVFGVGLHYDLATFGVKLFFCISGFIIYKSTVSLPPGRESASLFARRRLIRIVPLYWAVTLIYAAKLAMQGASPTLMDLVRSLLFVPFADDRAQMRPVLGAGWTLNFEMLFYTVLCVAIFLDRRHRFAAAAAVFFFLLAAHWFGVVGQYYSPGDTDWGLLANPVLLFFLAGMAVASLTQGGGTNAGLPKTFSGGLLVMIAVLFGFVVPAATFGLGLFGEPGSVAVVLLEVAVCFLLVYVCVKPYQAGRRGLIQRCAVAAGDGSYSTYLVHGFIMGPAARLVSTLGLEVGAWVFALIMVVLCTLVGVFIYRFFEYPLQRGLNALWGGSRQPSAPVAV